MKILLKTSLLLGFMLGVAVYPIQAERVEESRSIDLDSGSPSKGSLYQLPSEWITSEGKKIHMSDLAGKIQVVAIGYTSCPYSCPVVVSMMKQVQKSLPEEVRSGVGFVLVSMDPSHDSIEVLKKYAEKKGLEGESWTLLHGSEDDLRELAILLGVKYRREKSGEYAHSTLITVLNSAGEIANRHVGLNYDLKETVEVIKNLTAAAQH